MNVAIYHNLPPGGALRMLHEFVRRSHTEHEYDLYTLDLGRFDAFAYARDRAEQHDLTPWVARHHRYPVVPPAVAAVLPQKGWTLTTLGWMERAQRRIAADINSGSYDVALVHPCRTSHTPYLLRHLSVPSLAYMQEYRRRSFEAGYQEPDATAGLARRAVGAALERELRTRDRAAVLAAGRIACNSFYTAECIRRSYGREAAVCHPGVDGDVFNLGPTAATEPAGGGMRVISVGALEPFKAHDLVVKALGLLPASARPVLDLVYERFDPAYRAEIETLAKSSGVDLHMHAGISDARLAEMFRAASATVLTAQLEPFGLVPLESLACGTPVVAVREGGFRETVDDGNNGYLVERSAPAVADGVSRVLAGGLGRTPEQLRFSVIPAFGWAASVKRQLEELAIAADEGRR